MARTVRQALSLRITLMVTPIQVFIVGSAAALAYWIHHRYAPGLLATFLVFYFGIVVSTLLVLKVIRTVFPLKYGVYTFEKHPQACAVVIIQEFLSMTYLHLLEAGPLIPPFLRKFYYRLLGARIGKGLIPICGRLIHPSLITIEEDAGIGDEASLDGMATMSPHTIVLGPVHVRKGAIIGGKALVGPWATVGENAVVSAMSVVPLFTSIPPNEIWAGNPARKVGEIPAGERAEAASAQVERAVS